MRTSLLQASDSSQKSLKTRFQVAGVVGYVIGLSVSAVVYATLRLLEHLGAIDRATPFPIELSLVFGFIITSLYLRRMVKDAVIGPMVDLQERVLYHMKNAQWKMLPGGYDCREIDQLSETFSRLLASAGTHEQQMLETNERFQTAIARLSEAKEAAEAAGDAKTQFMARMSHEIRTPINGILGMVDLLMNANLNDGQQQLARTLQTSGKTLLQIVDGLLDFAKLEVGKLVLETTPFSLRKLVEDVVTLVGPTAHAKQIDIAACIDPQLPELLEGDPFRLRQVLMNLIGNAIKFTPEGEVSVEVDYHHGHGVHIAVRDSGVGIPADALEKIFEPFAQADVQTSRRFGGTGLGLSIAQQLTELMQGTIRVESTLNIGSTFHIDLPLEPSPDNRPRNQHPDLKGKSVLVVEPNPASARSLLALLDSLGLKAKHTNRLSNGIDMLRRLWHGRTPLDFLIVSDQPDGAELVQRLPMEPALGQTHVLLTTPLGRLKMLETLPTNLKGSILTKPFRRHDVQSALLRSTQRKLPLETTATPSTPAPVTPNRPHALVAEDNPVNAAVIKGMLSANGLAVTVVENGKLAVEAARRQHFDIMLFDGQMPEMDGPDAARIIRSGERQAGKTPLTPLLIVTADAVDNARERYLQQGMDDFLSKPFSREDLMALLEKWLPRPRAGNTPATSVHYADGKQPLETLSVTPLNLPVLDPKALALVASVAGADDAGFLRHLVELYHTDMQKSLSALAAAILDDDEPVIRKLAHKMKSSSANLGAKRLAELARQMEQEPEMDWEDAFQSLQETYQATRKALAAELQGAPA